MINCHLIITSEANVAYFVQPQLIMKTRPKTSLAAFYNVRLTHAFGINCPLEASLISAQFFDSVALHASFHMQTEPIS